jgi:hypothetical protein
VGSLSLTFSSFALQTRFSNQPQIYKSFLEILHTYHKEQHTIKDVYDQVRPLLLCSRSARSCFFEKIVVAVKKLHGPLRSPLSRDRWRF